MNKAKTLLCACLVAVLCAGLSPLVPRTAQGADEELRHGTVSIDCDGADEDGVIELEVGESVEVVVTPYTHLQYLGCLKAGCPDQCEINHDGMECFVKGFGCKCSGEKVARSVDLTVTVGDEDVVSASDVAVDSKWINNDNTSFLDKTKPVTKNGTVTLTATSAGETTVTFDAATDEDNEILYEDNDSTLITLWHPATVTYTVVVTGEGSASGDDATDDDATDDETTEDGTDDGTSGDTSKDDTGSDDADDGTTDDADGGTDDDATDDDTTGDATDEDSGDTDTGSGSDGEASDDDSGDGTTDGDDASGGDSSDSGSGDETDSDDTTGEDSDSGSADDGTTDDGATDDGTAGDDSSGSDDADDDSSDSGSGGTDSDNDDGAGDDGDDTSDGGSSDTGADGSGDDTTDSGTSGDDSSDSGSGDDDDSSDSGSGDTPDSNDGTTGDDSSDSGSSDSDSGTGDDDGSSDAETGGSSDAGTTDADDDSDTDANADEADYTGAGSLFKDYASGRWWSATLDYMAATGYMQGYSSGDKAGYFGVGDTLTRAQLVTILWRIACAAEAAAYASDVQAATLNLTGMDDVADGAWYTAAANWAVEAGVVNGKELADGTRYFDPYAATTFQELVAIIANYCDAEGRDAADTSVLDSAFSDGSSVSSWAATSMAWAVEAGLVSGYEASDGTRELRARTSVTRERAATVIMNALSTGLME